MLGLYNSVWHWYRPRGGLSLDEVRDFFVARCLAVAGLPGPAVSAGAKRARPPSVTRDRQAAGARPTMSGR